MTTSLNRRELLARLWKWAVGLLATAGAWTSLDLLKPSEGAAVGPVRTVSAGAVPDATVIEIAEVRGYLTKAGDEVVALSWRCPHLGCKVPWCSSSKQFECPCHGSVFNRIGEYRRGPSPRGMDRMAIDIVDGEVVVDPASVTDGAPPGAETIDEPAGPECI